MTRSVGLAHVVHEPDGTVVGIWGSHVLKTAFQPIFAFVGGKLRIAAFEGLLRPFRDGVAVPPGTFFGLIPPIDRMHVETLSRTLHLFNAGKFLDPAASVFVNFDPSVFADRELTDIALRDMRLVLHETGIEPDRVVCEVTEQKSASEATLFAFVSALRDHGFRIAVDDYGAEDSDIHRIERLRPDIVKFDAQWTTQLMNSGAGFALLAQMVTTFAARGITTVFEGIEHGWQLELAEKSGASMVQGFAIARPQVVPTNFSSFRMVEDASAIAAPETAAIRHHQQIAPARAFGRRAAPPA
jgi:EAL domain-containing protein (putative c-di-GMP-specific phosphodiesterase class I)